MQDDKLMGQMHRLLHQPPPHGKAPLCEEEDTGDTFLEMFLQPRDQWDQPDTAGGGGEEEEEEEEEGRASPPTFEGCVVKGQSVAVSRR